MYIFVVSCSDRNMDNTELLKFKDPKYYNNPEQYDEFVRYVFSSYPSAATVTSSRPFHHFHWHCQHCFFPASSPAQFKAHTSDCPAGKENIAVFCGHCGHTLHVNSYTDMPTDSDSTHNTHAFQTILYNITDPAHHLRHLLLFQLVSPHFQRPPHHRQLCVWLSNSVTLSNMLYA